MSGEPGVALNELAKLLRVGVTGVSAEGSADVAVQQARIKKVTQDSRQIESDTLFCCITGAELDGHQFAASAVDAGAVALLTERPLGLGVEEVVVA
ncbi:MAG: Mur ligase domain-containing protein, partial [Microthrixaceae bacterium]